LDDGQKAKVHKIQARYRSEAQTLREKLGALAGRRDQQLAAVLKPAQRRKLKQLSGIGDKVPGRTRSTPDVSTSKKRQTKKKDRG
jgi:hypothetical protein